MYPDERTRELIDQMMRKGITHSTELSDMLEYNGPQK
jgi:ferritin-like protein